MDFSRSLDCAGRMVLSLWADHDRTPLNNCIWTIIVDQRAGRVPNLDVEVVLPASGRLCRCDEEGVGSSAVNRSSTLVLGLVACGVHHQPVVAGGREVRILIAEIGLAGRRGIAWIV